MLDFLMISTRSGKRGIIEIYPKFIIRKSSDLMIRGGDFYAIWIEERGLWSTDEQDAVDLIDRELDRYAEENRQRFGNDIRVMHMWDAESGMIDTWHKYCQKQMKDQFHIYDFCSKKQSLKKWEIELGIHHQELGLPWDQPVPESMWPKVAEYCDNDVIAEEAVFFARQADFIAREILADVAGMTVNDTTNSLTAKIIFGGNKKPQDQFQYRDMGDVSQIYDPEADLPWVGEFDQFTAFDKKHRPIFPGYKFENGKSTYRGEEVGEGGYVYAEPGMYVTIEEDVFAAKYAEDEHPEE